MDIGVSVEMIDGNASHREAVCWSATLATLVEGADLSALSDDDQCGEREDVDANPSWLVAM